MHKLLLSQLKRYMGTVDAIPEEWQRFIEAVDDTYHQIEEDRTLLEHSLGLASQELFERNQQLRADIAERKQVEEALRKRAVELEAVAEVSTLISTILDTSTLLYTVVDLGKEHFGLYHAHIYLLNEAMDTLTLAAGAGEVGRQMVAQGWSIPLKKKRSLVARAARTRRGVIANNVRETPDWLPNPSLPETRSELAVPIILGDQVLGVLDVQADEIGYFTEEDVRIQTTLAAQVAVALQNSRSFAEQQQTGFLLSKRVRELNCLNEIGRAITEAPPIAELLQWVTERVPAAMQYPELCQVAIQYNGQLYGVAEAIKLPTHMTNALRIGQEVLGRMYVAYREKQDFLDEESAMLGGIASRVSAYIESQRLVEQIQQRATELEDAQTFLDSIIENMPTALFVKEAKELRFVRWNKASATLFGFSKEGIVGKNDYDFFPKEEADFFTAKDREVLAGGQLVEIPEEPIHTAQQGLRFLRTTKVPIFGADGQPRYLLGLSEDITERKATEEALHENEARLSEALKIASMANWEFDVATQTFTFNDQFYALFRTTAEQEGGYLMPAMQYAQKFVHPDDTFMVGAEIEQALKTTDPNYSRQIEHRIIRADGSEGYILVRFRVVKDEHGRTIKTVGANQDITERKQAEEELSKFKLGIERSSDAVFLTDIDGTIIYVNPAFEKIYGFTPEEAIGQTPRILKSGLISPEQYHHFWQKLLNKESVTGEIVNKAKDGRLVYIAGNNNPILDEHGHIIGFLAAHRDITERKTAEEALRASEERFTLAVAGTQDGIWDWDIKNSTLYWSPRLKEMLGYKPDEIEVNFDTFASFLHPEDAKTTGAALEAHLKHQALYNIEQRLRAKSGEYVWFQVRGQAVWDEADNPIRMTGVSTDITGRKQAEEALRKSQERLSEALETAKLANWEFDVATQTFTFNDQFYALFRTTAEQEGGYLMPAMQYAQKFVHPDDAFMVGAEVEQALKTTDPNYSRQIEHRIIRADGSEGYILVRFRVVKDEHGRTIKTVGANQDITERKQAEEALKEEQERAQIILESITVPMIISRVPDGTILYANDPHSRFFSVPREQLIGQPTRNFFEDPTERDKYVALLRSQGVVNDYEVRLRKSNGELCWVLVSSRLFNFRGEAATLTILIDITERKQVEAERERLLAEVEATYRQYVQREWEQFLSGHHQGGWHIEHQQNIASSLSDEELAKVQAEVAREGQAKVVTDHNGQPTQPAMVAPITLRGQVIGTLSLQDIDPNRQWTDEEKALLETVSEQLALTVENLRLFDDTQKRATREQLTRQITDKMRAAPDVDTIIQTGLAELAKALGVSRTYLKLVTKPEDVEPSH